MTHRADWVKSLKKANNLRILSVSLDNDWGFCWFNLWRVERTVLSFICDTVSGRRHSVGGLSYRIE